MNKNEPTWLDLRADIARLQLRKERGKTYASDKEQAEAYAGAFSDDTMKLRDMHTKHAKLESCTVEVNLVRTGVFAISTFDPCCWDMALNRAALLKLRDEIDQALAVGA